MRYFWDVEISDMVNIEVKINNGTSLETADDAISVSYRTGYRF